MSGVDHINSMPRAELTLRGIVIGVAITLVFTAANVYFGLKAGLTFATSIPAAVISMALLRGFGNASVQENNIVQTIASAAGTLSAIIFVLPGLVMIGWWTGFPYWQSAAICALGGVLGVMYTIPLRRALVTGSTLPYPEGVACAEVLKVGASGEDDATGAAGGARVVLVGALVSAGYALLVQTRLVAGDVADYFHIGHRGSASGFDFSLSFALFADRCRGDLDTGAAGASGTRRAGRGDGRCARAPGRTGGDAAAHRARLADRTRGPDHAAVHAADRWIAVVFR